jgi:hypothetical protein
MSTKNSSKANVIVEIQQMIAGLQKHFAGATIMLGGVSITVSDLIAELTSFLAQLTAVSTTRNAWQQQVQLARTAEVSRIDPLRAQLASYMDATFGETSSVLTDFGLKPRKKPVRSAQNKATAAEKMLATREARGTKGSRQKAGIHGVLPTATPPVSPAAPTPGAAAPVVPPNNGVKP